MSDHEINEEARSLLTPTKLLTQLVGFAVGAALLAWVVRNAIREGDWDQIVHADWRLIAAMLGCTVVSTLLNGTAFWITIQPVKSIPYWNLQRLNVVANMLNYAPVRLGAIARVLYHLRVDGLSLLQVGAWFSLIGFTLVLAVASCLLATMVRPDLDWIWLAIVAGQILLGGMVFRVVATLPLVARHGRGIDRMGGNTRALWGAIGLRLVDLSAFTGRMAIAAAIVGIELTWARIVILALVALAASLIPFGRLGFREFCVAATGHQLATASGEPVNMDQLALVESAGEALVFIPVGAILLLWYRRKWARAKSGDEPKTA